MTDLTDLAELRSAAATVRDAATSSRPANPVALAGAYTTIADRRSRTTGDIRDAIDHLLDDATWHDGPFTLRQAITHLADTLDLPAHDTVHISEQLALPLGEPRS